MKPVFVDLFAGVGGFSVGLEMAGFRCGAAVEIESDLADCLSKNHLHGGGASRGVATDVRKVDPESLIAMCGVARGALPLLVGGPPCQGFSTIGKRRVDDERNSLVFQYMELVKELRPQAFLLENVPGMLSMQGGDVIRRVVAKARRLGYRKVRVARLDASDCGVPQRRKRVIIYGDSAGRLPDLEAHFPNGERATVDDAIRDLPRPLETLCDYGDVEAVPYGATEPSAYAAGLRSRTGRVTRWKPVQHTARIAQAYGALQPGQTDNLTKCYRLILDSPARTLRAGCKGRTACRPVHPMEARVITVREAARIQSFPDDMTLPATTSGAHRAIGNAVPPLFAKRLGELVLSSLS